MRWSLILGVGLVAPTPAMAATDYDCVLDTPRAIHSNERGEVTAIPILFPGMADRPWNFALHRDEIEAQIVWRNSPIQLSGSTSLIPTSAGSYAGFLVGRGPCLFTETHCGATIHFAEQEDGTLKIQLHPIALTSTEAGGREPFVVYLSGACTAKEATE